jgi:hypothetical protein
MMKTVLMLALVAAVTFAASELSAAPETTPELSEPPKTIEGEGAKPEAGEAAKPDNGVPAVKPENGASPAQPGSAETPQPESGPLSLEELTRDGFEIHATAFIPAEAVTRHSGKVSSDAIVITLQKTTQTAVCFYTLKAYVGKKLTTIPACTVHR